MKRIAFALLATMLIAACNSVDAQTQFSVDGLKYTVIRGNTVSVTGSFLDYVLHDTVIVPEYVTYAGVTYQVVRLDIYAFEAQKYLTHVSLPPSIVNISQACFYASGLKSVEYHENLQSIQVEAFYATKIDSIRIPATVSNIEVQAFFCADSLECITVDPDNTHYCSIDGVLFNADTTFLHTYPANKRDTVYHIPDGVTGIAPGAFAVNRHLRHVYLPGSVTDIGNEAFVSCTSLVSINIPSSASIHGNPFSWCPSLENIDIDSNNNQIMFLPQEHAIVSLDGDTLFYMWMYENVIVVPAGVKYIAPYALAHQFRIAGIVIPEGVEKMAEKACYNTNTRSVALPSTLKEIGEECFAHNYHLNSVDMREGLEVLGPMVFSSCFSLPSITLPNSLKSIPYGAFCNDRLLKRVVLGDSVESIGAWAFIKCDMSKSNPLVFPPTLRFVGDSAFEESKLVEIEFTGEVDSVGNGAFAVGGQGISSLTLVQDIPPRIGNDAFIFDKNHVIHIPCGSRHNYETALHWSSFYDYDDGDCEDAVGEATGNTLHVYAKGGDVVVEGAAGREIEIYNAVGHRVAHGQVMQDCQMFRVPAKGLYLVRTDHDIRKVVVQ